MLVAMFFADRWVLGSCCQC